MKKKKPDNEKKGKKQDRLEERKKKTKPAHEHARTLLLINITGAATSNFAILH